VTYDQLLTFFAIQIRIIIDLNIFDLIDCIASLMLNLEEHSISNRLD